MKLKTSFFNAAVLRKDITRFFPVWSIYLLFLLLVYSWQPTLAFRNMTYPLFIYAGICAITLFGDLLVPRRCSALHAMPMRREGWFFVHTLAGLLFYLVPTCAVYLGAAIVTGTPYRWLQTAGFLGASTLQYLFFFGMALLCVMLSGNRIGVLLMYAIINFLAPVIQWVFTQLYEPFLYGVPLDASFFNYLSPVLRMAQHVPGYYYLPDCTGGIYSYWDGDWWYFLICSGIGIAAAVLALLMYRHRRLEAAGDLASVRWLGHVFAAVFGLMSGVIVFSLMDHDPEAFWFLLPYVLVGFFAGRMLQMRRVNIFQPGGILGALCLITVLFGSIWMTRTDALGLIRYVPEAAQVESVVLNLSDSASYQYRCFEEAETVVRVPESIAEITQVHERLAQEHSELPLQNGQEHPLLYLTYQLKNGTQVRRYLPIDTDGESFGDLRNTLSSWQVVFDETDWRTYCDNVYYIEAIPTRTVRTVFFCDPDTPVDPTVADITVLRKDMRQKLLSELLQDCDTGFMMQDRGSEDAEPSYTVILKSRDEAGKEKELVIKVYSTLEFSHYLEFCTDVGMTCPGKTVTDTTEVPPYAY